MKHHSVTHIIKNTSDLKKKGKRKVQGVPQSQTAALPRHQEEAETDKTKARTLENHKQDHASHVAVLPPRHSILNL